MITLDSKGPTVSLSGLANGAVLDVTASVRFVYSASDESGVTADATLDTNNLASGSPIDAGPLTAGSHLITSRASTPPETSRSHVTFIVRAAVRIEGEVEQAIAASVDASARAALQAERGPDGDRAGQEGQAIAQLEQFIAQVQASRQEDRRRARRRMISWARDLIARV